MPLFVLTYDLMTPGQNYDAVIAKLQNAQAKRVLYSTWVLSTTWNAAQVRDWMRGFTDSNDRLLVAEIAQGSWAAWKAMFDINQI